MPDQRNRPTSFEFREDRGWLFVSLERPIFEQVVRALQENADISELAEIEVGEVSEILVYDSSRHCPKVQSSWWRDRLTLIGCGLVASIIGFVLLMGILAIVGLAPLPR